MKSDPQFHFTRLTAVLGTILALTLFSGLVRAQQPPVQAASIQAAAEQAPAQPGSQAPAAQASRPAGEFPHIVITAGKSQVLPTDFDVTRIALTNPAVADATVVQPRQILIDAKAPGTISLIVWGSGTRQQYDIVVEPGITTLQTQLQSLFPGEDIQVSATDEALVLSGHVSSNTVMLRAAEIAQASASKLKVINMLQVPGGNGSQQVILQVRFAEVNRNALTQLGVNFFTGPTGYRNWVGRTTSGQFPAPNFTNIQPEGVTNQQSLLTFSDFLNLFVFNTKYNIGAVLQALKSTGYLQSLAEPNLIAYNNQNASFLAGGEIPVPVGQGLGAISVTYREYGIRLTFRPTIAGDVIRLHLRPEVSSLDFANGISLSGFRIPALSTRYAETEVELRDGQSFAIAGLMNNISQTNRQMIPILGDLPIVGYLFKSKAMRKEQTELLVLVTPRLVRPLNPDEVPTLPTNPKNFLPPGGGIGKDDGGTTDAPPATVPPKKKQSGK